MPGGGDDVIGPLLPFDLHVGCCSVAHRSGHSCGAQQFHWLECGLATKRHFQKVVR